MKLLLSMAICVPSISDVLRLQAAESVRSVLFAFGADIIDICVNWS